MPSANPSFQASEAEIVTTALLGQVENGSSVKLMLLSVAVLSVTLGEFGA